MILASDPAAYWRFDEVGNTAFSRVGGAVANAEFRDTFTREVNGP